MPIPDYMTPKIWVDQIFSSQEALRGGIVKRKIADVERLAGRELFLAEADRLGFQVYENHKHFVVFCNARPVIPVGAARAFEGPWKAAPLRLFHAISKSRSKGA